MKSESKKILTRYFFEEESQEKLTTGQIEYMLQSSIDFYQNYLEWFYGTFCMTDKELRHELFKYLETIDGMKILITGVGLGHELIEILKIISDQERKNCTIVAQDISSVFIQHIYENIGNEILEKHSSKGNKIIIFNGDACCLPLNNDEFDYIHHFGGINRFANIEKAIDEMARCVKPQDGVVVFSDESVAPWLRNTDIGKMVIENNSLYAHSAPITQIPINATNVTCEYIVRNCFYMIKFTKLMNTLKINPNIRHKSPRGGTMHKRYHGKLDGINPELKSWIVKEAKSKKISQNELLESLIQDRITESEEL
ncbi:class I SAM-dependent methyltransferase [Synechococcus sp. BIOS-U3-1]|uniref:class I SAM-dependent methyltransferase n=1 Tax=Synechococcus sp. BIOS-U3-1 TaxID=1400865 RepID=UPI0016441927|nr:class I SAM-dependent methyltransferase [Synechococcus sp. BIOS-U3-1]